MSLLKANTIKPVTSSGDLSLQGDSGGSAVDCLNITSAGDINFTGNTDAKIKLPSAGGIYESDGSTLGSGVALPAGGVVQVLQASDPDTYSTTSETFVDIPGFTLTITPTFTGSKILVSLTWGISNAGATNGTWLQLHRNINGGSFTNIAGGTASAGGANTSVIANYHPTGSYQLDTGSLNYLDSPSYSAGNAIIYKVLMRTQGSANAAWIGMRGDDGNDATSGRVASIIVLQEISQ